MSTREDLNLLIEKYRICKKTEQVTMTARLVEDLGADSLDVVELIMAFEDEFGVAISDEDAQNIKSVNDVVSYIESRMEF